MKLRARKAIAFTAALLLLPPAAQARSWLWGLPPFRPADAATQARALGRGINIMAADPVFDADAGAIFKDRYFRDIAGRGFRTVRVPQAFVRHADAAGRPDPIWLAKLDRVVREASLDGLNIIIDNNGGCSAQGAACLQRTARIWRHVARHYRRVPANVLFELYNEPDDAITPDLWNAGIGSILAAIRASNRTRNVIIGTAHSYNVRDLANLRLPEGDRHIIASFHYYEPYYFTHQGAGFLPAVRRPAVGAHFGSAGDLAVLNRNFDYAATWSAWSRRPVYLGEFGVLETANPSDRVFWINAVARAAEARGISWAYWQFSGDFTAFDTTRDAWNEPVARALIP